jgi:hypothetical protein
VLIVAAAADNRDPFMLPMNPVAKARARECHAALGKGDLGWATLLLRVFNRWALSVDKRRFCEQNYVRPGESMCGHVMRARARACVCE